MTFEITVFHDSLLFQIIPGNQKSSFIAATRNRNLLLLTTPLTVNKVLLVGAAILLKGIDLFGGKRRRGTCGCRTGIYNFSKFTCQQNIISFNNFGRTSLSFIANFYSFCSSFGRNNNNPVRSPAPINGCRSRIFQNLYGLYITGIQKVKIRSHKTVDHIQRIVVAQNRIGSPYTNTGITTGRTVGLPNLHPGRTALQHLIQTVNRLLCKFFRRNYRQSPGNIGLLLRTLPRPPHSKFSIPVPVSRQWMICR